MRSHFGRISVFTLVERYNLSRAPAPKAYPAAARSVASRRKRHSSRAETPNYGVYFYAGGESGKLRSLGMASSTKRSKTGI
jgi:hypothetical protein